MIRYTITTQSGMPWVAINPTTTTIYSAVWNDCCFLQIYNNDFSFNNTLQIKPNLPSEIQGYCCYCCCFVLFCYWLLLLKRFLTFFVDVFDIVLSFVDF